MTQWQPLDEIRDYFGDHVALYFAWVRGRLRVKALSGFGGCGTQFLESSQTRRKKAQTENKQTKENAHNWAGCAIPTAEHSVHTARFPREM